MGEMYVHIEEALYKHVWLLYFRKLIIVLQSCEQLSHRRPKTSTRKTPLSYSKQSKCIDFCNFLGIIIPNITLSSELSRQHISLSMTLATGMQTEHSLAKVQFAECVA